MSYSERYQKKEFTISNYLANYQCTDEEVRNCYKVKLLLEKEIKLREFNFKLLNGILPCNVNLVRWKIKTDCACDVCGERQSIQHLLYDCCYVQPLWTRVNRVFSINVSYRQILGLDVEFDYDCIVTLVCFIIYKQWLILSLNDKGRNSIAAYASFKEELLLRSSIYQGCKSISNEHIENITSLTNCFS